MEHEINQEPLQPSRHDHGTSTDPQEGVDSQKDNTTEHSMLLPKADKRKKNCCALAFCIAMWLCFATVIAMGGVMIKKHRDDRSLAVAFILFAVFNILWQIVSIFGGEILELRHLLSSFVSALPMVIYTGYRVNCFKGDWLSVMLIVASCAAVFATFIVTCVKRCYLHEKFDFGCSVLFPGNEILRELGWLDISLGVCLTFVVDPFGFDKPGKFAWYLISTLIIKISPRTSFFALIRPNKKPGEENQAGSEESQSNCPCSCSCLDQAGNCIKWLKGAYDDFWPWGLVIADSALILFFGIRDREIHTDQEGCAIIAFGIFFFCTRVTLFVLFVLRWICRCCKACNCCSKWRNTCWEDSEGNRCCNCCWKCYELAKNPDCETNNPQTTQQMESSA